MLDHHDGPFGELKDSHVKIIGVYPAGDQFTPPLDSEDPYHLIVEEKPEKVNSVTSEKPQR